MRTLRVIVITILVSCFLQIVVNAQQDKQANATPTGLALEVTYFKGKPPAYQVVPNNCWYGLFRRIESQKPATESLPVQAVNIASRMEGADVRVVVSVHVGEKFFERQDPVGSYLLRENEKLIVSDLTTFGLEPFEISLIKVVPKSVSLPSVTSEARSVEVINVQPVESTFPTYQLTLLNTSSKNISALFVETFVDGKLRTSGLPHNQNREPLIAAGATYEYKRQLNNVARPAKAGYTPETPSNQAVVIKTAVFEDGTYEGEARPAAEFRVFALGDKQQLEQLVALYQKALESTESDVEVVLNNLRARASALGTEAEQPALNKLLSDFASLPENDKVAFKEAVEFAMFELRKDALKEIDEFRQKQGSSINKETTRAWLSESRDKFQKRLDRLQKL